MKSTSSDKTFTMEDFEHGLMLAGYLMPSSISELQERDALEEHDKKGKNKTAPTNIYFKRIVLAADILYKLHSEPTMGKVKFQKMMYLCEHAAGMNLEDRYIKQAAGPFDNKFMHTIHLEFKRLNWFSLEKIESSNITRYKYSPLDNVEKYKEYYSNYYKQEDRGIQHIIELFRKLNTDATELAATVLACYLELSAKSRFDKENLLYLFYDWSKEKSRFAKERVIVSFKWLQTNGLIDTPETI